MCCLNAFFFFLLMCLVCVFKTIVVESKQIELKDDMPRIVYDNDDNTSDDHDIPSV